VTWAKIDDRAPQHPKLLQAGPEACWMWVAGLCYANAHTTDGLVPSYALLALSPGSWPEKRARALADRLVEVGLWHREGDAGWRIHDYEDHQEPAMKSEVERRKALTRERKRRQRRRERGEPEDGHAPVTRDSHAPVTRDNERDGPRDTQRDVPRDAAGDVRGDASVDVTPPRPVPTRPVPISPSESDRAPAQDPEEMNPARVWRALDEAWFEAFAERLPGCWSPLFRADAEAVLERCGGTAAGVQAEVQGYVRWARTRDVRPAEPWRKFFGSIGSWASRLEGDKARAKAGARQRERIAAERHLKPASNGTPDAAETDRKLAKVAPPASEIVPLGEAAAGVLATLRGGGA
jgi:hypothetical protein